MKATELLEQDHRKVEELFDQAESADRVMEKRQIFGRIRTVLDLHTYIEETVLYPYFANMDDFKDQIAESYAEHQEVKDLLREISTIHDENEFSDKLTELMDNVNHHVKEEEEELFPKIERTLSAADLERLGQRLDEAKVTRKAAA